MGRTFTKFSLLALSFVCLFFGKGYSIGIQNLVGARDVSLGNGTVALITPFSVYHNQASIAKIDRLTFAIDYRQPFMIEGFAEKTVVVIIPTNLSGFAFGMQQTGISGYSESRFNVAMAKNLGKRFSAGLQFNYFLVNFPEQGRNRGTMLIEFGLLFQPSNLVTIGLHVFNPSGASIESLNYNAELPVGATSGLAIQPSSNLLFVSAVSYTLKESLNIQMGIEYQFSDSFCLRGGLSGKPFRHSAGIGYRWNNFSVDFACVHHEMLGYSPSVSLSLFF